MGNKIVVNKEYIPKVFAKYSVVGWRVVATNFGQGFLAPHLWNKNINIILYLILRLKVLRNILNIKRFAKNVSDFRCLYA